MDDMTIQDEGNTRLERVFPNPFIRTAVIRNANYDLAIGGKIRSAVSIDPCHMNVASLRFLDSAGWKLRGYVLQFLFPDVGTWSWESIASLRQDRNIRSFRRVLRDVEQEVGAEAAGGDIEAAAHHIYEKYLANAFEKLPSVPSVAWTAAKGFVIGGMAGIVTSGITGPTGIAVSSALATAPSTIIDIRRMVRDRRARGWISIHQRIVG